MGYQSRWREASAAQLDLVVIKHRSLQGLLIGLYAEALSQAVIRTRKTPLRQMVLVQASNAASGERQRLEKKQLDKALDALRRDGAIDHSEHCEISRLVGYRFHFASDLMCAGLLSGGLAGAQAAICDANALDHDLERLRSSLTRIEALQPASGAHCQAAKRLRLVDQIHTAEMKRLQRRIEAFVADMKDGRGADRTRTSYAEAHSG